MTDSTAPSDYYSNRRSPVAQAARDFTDSIGRYELWGLLGWYDIKQRYRRSLIGPLWLTISMGVTVAALGFLYAHLFGLKVEEYLPFLALGFILWQFIAGIMGEASNAFVAVEGLIKQTQTAFFVHVFRMVWRNLIILGHNMVIYLVLLALFDIGVGVETLYFIPAFLMVIVLAVGVALLLGIICTRFRDVGPLVQNLTQLAFFVTPIIWKPELLKDRAMFLDFNPFYHVITILRAPLLLERASLLNWVVSGGLTVGILALAFLTFSATRRRLPYWL